MKKRYHGSRVAPSSMRKGFTGVMAIVLILVCVVGGTVAFLATKTDAVKNTFTPGEVTCKVQETVENGTKKSVTVNNTGNIDAYIRVAVVANTVDSADNIIGSADVSAALCGSDWIKSGDYYYWKYPVAADASTGELLKSGSSIDLNGKQVTILAEAIQADGTDNSGKHPVTLAWGVTVNADGTLS